MTKTYSLPDVSGNSRVYAEYVIDNKSYYFIFDVRETSLYVSVFLDSEYSEPVLEGYALTVGIDLFARVKNRNICNGKFVLEPLYHSETILFPENLSKNFCFVYYKSDDENIIEEDL
jgi:hypothetical protein